MPCFHPMAAFDFRDTLKFFSPLDFYRKLCAEGVDVSYLRRVEDKGGIMFFLPFEWSTFTDEFLDGIFEQYQIKRISVPCGQCIGCRLERSRQWAIRCIHEASLYDNNCFITLTYRTECLPPGGSLRPKDFTDFMKRFRKKYGEGIRYFQCGEYGEHFSRPHHHACIFNFDFPDKELLSFNRGNPIYTSESLSKLWSFGFSSIGNVTFESAAYVARYIMKKVNGDAAEQHYDGRHPEYITMSRRPGIASDWFKKYYSDCYPKDYITIRDGLKCRPPKFYDRLFDVNHSEELLAIKERRQKFAEIHLDSDQRLRDRELSLQLRSRKLKRSLEG